jgi:hypothetical protein
MSVQLSSEHGKRALYLLELNLLDQQSEQVIGSCYCHSLFFWAIVTKVVDPPHKYIIILVPYCV